MNIFRDELIKCLYKTNQHQDLLIWALFLCNTATPTPVFMVAPASPVSVVREEPLPPDAEQTVLKKMIVASHWNTIPRWGLAGGGWEE